MSEVNVSDGVVDEEIVSTGVARRTRLSARTKFDLVFDSVLFVAFAIAYAEDFTGLSLHEWFGIGFGVALLVHFSLHWDWVVRTTRGLLTTSGRRRFMWLMNLALLGDLILCVGSGILISRFRVFGVTFDSGEFWNNLHGTTAAVAIALVGIHIGLDWRWISNAFRRITRISFWQHDGAATND
jgi:hypothetical protein